MTDTSLEQTQSSAPLNFTFTAKEEIFRHRYKNIFLSILTLGIYWFWGKEITKYLYNKQDFKIIILIITQQEKKDSLGF